VSLLVASGAHAANFGKVDSTLTFYSLVAFGTAEHDSTIPFPVPIAFISVADSVHTSVRVRFPHLGLFGSIEDTISTPTLNTAAHVLAFEAIDPLLQLKFPKTPYAFFVDVIDRASGRVIQRDPHFYPINVGAYSKTRLAFLYPPTAGLGALRLRRRFEPRLLDPITLETNPGWQSQEILDTNGIYSLIFQNPRATEKIYLTLTVRPAPHNLEHLDSAYWESFKNGARVTFGKLGIAINSLGDFQVENVQTRSMFLTGYEFLAKRKDGSLDYVATFLTPEAVVLLIAPLQSDLEASELEYFRAIARSFSLKH
jgi:hypothetical protein